MALAEKRIGSGYSLYLQHFGLTREPFSVTPDPSFLYLTASHKEALAQLTYGIKARKGFVVLTGEVGTGKTTLIHALLEELDGNTQTALIFNTIVSPKDLLRYVCEDLGLIAYEKDQREVHDYLTLLNRFLLESYRKGDNVALIIDEAQNLSAPVLESVRLLSNFETSRDKLLQILLVGQPELGARLNAPELRQLKQRVSLRHHLRPLSFMDFRRYVAWRLELAGGIPSVFTPEALDTAYAYSGGTPRLINIICDSAMLTAYASDKKKIDHGIVHEVAKDLQLVISLEQEIDSAHQPPAIVAQSENRPKPIARKRNKGRDAVLALGVLSLLIAAVVGTDFSDLWRDFLLVKADALSVFVEWFNMIVR